MDEDVQRHVDSKNPFLRKAAYFTRDLAFLLAISPLVAGTYAGGFFGNKFGNYILEVYNNERTSNLNVDKKTNKLEFYLEQIIKGKIDIDKVNEIIHKSSLIVGLSTGFVLNIMSYKFIEKPQNSGVDYFFSPVASSLIDVSNSLVDLVLK